jgi:hypothetical protein
MKRYFLISLLGLFLFLTFLFANSVFGANYTFKSVRNERVSYDPAYFDFGTFNDIMAAAIITDLTASEAESILHTVRWTPEGGTQQEATLNYEGENFGTQWFLSVLAHDVEASSFPMWEDISYAFYIDGIFQPPSVFISSGTFRELTIPTAIYDPLTHVVTWQVVEVRNYKVRILGSTDQDDFLFDSETIRDKEIYQFTDPLAISLINSGAILAVEAREFKSTSEALNISIYITKTEPYPDFDYDGDVDGSDLIVYSEGNSGINIKNFSAEFGKSASL